MEDRGPLRTPAVRGLGTLMSLGSRPIFCPAEVMRAASSLTLNCSVNWL